MNELAECLQQGSIEASAPCRIDMGGTLDLSTFYLPLHHNQPGTFNAALDLRTRVHLSPFDGGKVKVSSRGFQSKIVDSRQAPFDHPLGLMMAVAAYFGADGVHVHIDSASPPRSALGGSSVAAVALVWCFAKAYARAGHAMPDRSDVALLAHAIEQSVAGVPCGLQDQLAAAYGGVNGWLWTAEPGKPPFERQALVSAQNRSDFDRRILVAYCGVPHVSKDINGTWVRDFLSGKHRTVWHRIAECSRQFIHALAQGDYQQAIDLMNQETDLRCQMTPEVLDDMGQNLVAAARRYECAARFTGAGGGGCLWALGEPEQIERLRPEWQVLLSQRDAAGILDASIDSDGLL